MTTIKKDLLEREQENEPKKKASCRDVAWEFFFRFLFCLLPSFMMIGDETRNNIVFFSEI